ncbi:MAG: hypothetical protein IH820_02860 [Bacteroidetes bacterium]|nr:hypothetical protein [Bacteroidota bacterium]
MSLSTFFTGRPAIVTAALATVIYPLAYWRYRSPLGDPSCDYTDCACIWCECEQGTHETMAACG